MEIRILKQLTLFKLFFYFQGHIIAIDKSVKKICKVKENCEKLELSNVHCFCYDSTKIVNENEGKVLCSTLMCV